MRHYELVVVLSPILSQEEATSSWDRVKELVLTTPSEITHEEQWGLRRLAYPIRKAGQTFLEGNYLLTRFSTENKLSSDLETHLQMSESVLRHILVKSLPQPPAPPQPVVTEVEKPVVDEAKTEPAAMEEGPAVDKAEGEEPAVAEVEEAAVEEPAVAEVEEAAVEESAVAEVEEAAVEEPAQEASGRDEEDKPQPGEDDTSQDKESRG